MLNLVILNTNALLRKKKINNRLNAPLKKKENLNKCSVIALVWSMLNVEGFNQFYVVGNHHLFSTV